jgi:hypothetical protein
MATIAFDKPSYNSGDTITVTVTDPSLVGIVETEADSYTEADGTKVSVSTTIQHPGAQLGTLTSSTGRVYTKVSQNGATVVYTSKA